MLGRQSSWTCERGEKRKTMTKKQKWKKMKMKRGPIGHFECERTYSENAQAVLVVH